MAIKTHSSTNPYIHAVSQRHTHVLRATGLAHVCLVLQIYLHVGVDSQMLTCSDPQFHTYTCAQLHKDAHTMCLKCTMALVCGQSYTYVCKLTVARSHTHLLRHAPHVQRDKHMLRPIEALTYFRHDVHVCSVLSMYTHLLRAIEAYAYTCPQTQKSHIHAQLTSAHVLRPQDPTHTHTYSCSHVLELQVHICMFRTATYTVCSDLPRYRCTRART